MLYPYVTIIVPAHNAQDTIQICLNSIMQLNYPDDRLEVILIDNNSTDETESIARKYPIRIFHEKQRKSSYAARNLGIKNSRGEILAFTDADCVVSKVWLKKLVSRCENSELGCFAGKISSYKPESVVEWFADADEENHDQFICVTKWSYAQTANVAYRKKVFEDIGLFNANLKSGGDVDFTWRMLKHGGFKIFYEPEAIVYHKHRNTIRDLYLQHRKYGEGLSDIAKMYPERVGGIADLVREFFKLSLRATLLLPKNIFKFYRGSISRVDLWYDLLKALCKLAYVDGRIRAHGLRGDGRISRFVIIRYILSRLVFKLKAKIPT